MAETIHNLTCNAIYCDACGFRMAPGSTHVCKSVETDRADDLIAENKRLKLEIAEIKRFCRAVYENREMSTELVAREMFAAVQRLGEQRNG